MSGGFRLCGHVTRKYNRVGPRYSFIVSLFHQPVLIGWPFPSMRTRDHVILARYQRGVSVCDWGANRRASRLEPKMSDEGSDKGSGGHIHWAMTRLLLRYDCVSGSRVSLATLKSWSGWLWERINVMMLVFSASKALSRYAGISDGTLRDAKESQSFFS